MSRHPGHPHREASGTSGDRRLLSPAFFPHNLRASGDVLSSKNRWWGGSFDLESVPAGRSSGVPSLHRLGSIVSRGFGSAQRLILEELAALGPGMGVVVGTDSRSRSSSLRRAAHGLDRAGSIRLARKLVDGRHRLVAFPSHVGGRS